MKKKWQLQDAKNRFSELVNEAQVHGPQIVTRRGEEEAIVLSMKDYRALKAGPKQSLADFLLDSPLRDSKIEITRDRSLPRDVSL